MKRIRFAIELNKKKPSASPNTPCTLQHTQTHTNTIIYNYNNDGRVYVFTVILISTIENETNTNPLTHSLEECRAEPADLI